MTAKNLKLATITGTSRTASRSFGDRVADVFNVKDYIVGGHALGSGVLDDAPGIQAAVDAWNGVGTLYFPPGEYKVASSIDISCDGPAGRIVGAGRGSTSITGSLPNGFIFIQGDGLNGPTEIAHLGLSNTSTNIGTGALSICNGSAHIHDCGFRGQICIYLPFNIYDMVIQNCGGVPNSHVTDGYIGTLMIAGYAPHIIGWRSTGPCETGFQLWGSNTSTLIGNGIENTQCAVNLGMATGWASDCTTVGDIITVGGTIGYLGDPNIFAGMQIYGTGLINKPWRTEPSDLNRDGTWIDSDRTETVTDSTTTLSGTTMHVSAIVGNSVGTVGYGLRVGAVVEGVGVLPNTIITAVPGGGPRTAGNYTVTPGSQSAGPITVTSTDADASGAKLTGNGFAGTYRLSRTPLANITTPVPIWTRFNRSIGGCTMAGLQTEACFIALYCNNVGTSQISSVGGNSAIGENGDKFGAQGYLPHSGFYIKQASNTLFSGCGGSNNTTHGSIYFEPGTSGNTCTFVSCVGVTNVDNSVTASISGTVLTVTALSAGAGIGIGLSVTGAGVTSNTAIIGGKASEVPTKTFTVTIASPAVCTRTAHGLAANTPIQFVDLTGGVALPTGISFNTTYYVKTVVDANSFTVSTSAGGTAINTSGSQSGTFYLVKADGSDGLSGYNNIGTYRVNNSQTVASEAMTLAFGPDWQLPTATEAGTALQFINCGTTNTVAKPTGLRHTCTFTSLPGQTGASSYIALLEGQEYNITDGQKSGTGTALFGDTVVGGGAQHIKVRYNGTNWTRCG